MRSFLENIKMVVKMSETCDLRVRTIIKNPLVGIYNDFLYYSDHLQNRLSVGLVV